MKYRLDEHSEYSMFPVISLKPGENGTIKFSGIYPDESTIHTDRQSVLLSVHGFGYPDRLVDFNNIRLSRFAKDFKLPYDELCEIRELEKAYRDSVMLTRA